MLTTLNINNFAIIKQLNIDFDTGMTVITGETGAGKSIAIDALSLCMGYRSDVGMIRNSCKQAQVSASFTIDKNSVAYNWLDDKCLLDEDQPNEVIIRRIINLNGPSRAYINEHPVSISFLKELTQYLVHLHGQHAPQLLLKNSYQLVLVDRYIHQPELQEQVAKAYSEYKAVEKAYQEFIKLCDNYSNTKQLLEYKYNELKDLNIKKGEYEQLEQDYKILSNIAMIQELNKKIINILSLDKDNINDLLAKSIRNATRLVEFDKKFANLKTMLDDASINIGESINEAQRLLSDDLNPADMFEIEQRMNAYNQVAKKNQILPEELYDYAKTIAQKLADLNKSIGNEDELLEQKNAKLKIYNDLALKLSKVRQKGAKVLSDKVVSIMQELNMKDAKFYIDVNYDPNNMSSQGSDDVRFMLNSNLGQQAQELSKVASGGELSRIALAIQLLTASHLDNGTLIFDEVDVGISGKTASVVGRIIRQLSSRIQVISVTHLAQVAAYANNHFQVEKFNEGNITNTKMTLLDYDKRVLALASLIGHEDLSPQAINNATNLLDHSQEQAQHLPE